jgi:hypothetical protein
MIYLNSEMLIGKGSHKQCFSHPSNLIYYLSAQQYLKFKNISGTILGVFNLKAPNMTYFYS